MRPALLYQRIVKIILSSALTDITVFTGSNDHIQFLDEQYVEN